jgi:CHAT domain-containing protein
VGDEGLVGLPQAFMKAGARQVLVSLWDVGDRSTAELMRLFYRGLLVEQREPAAALRAAQCAMRRDVRWRAPASWAGFVLQGDWR